MWHVIAGRVIAGVGGAGMSVIVSILITGEGHYLLRSSKVANIE